MTEPSRRAPLAAAALALAAVAALLVVLAGPGTRWELWHFRTGFSLMRWGAYAGVAAAVLGLVAALLAARRPGRRGLATALAALGLGAAAFLGPWTWRRSIPDVPPIHDVTTDTEDPPAFVSVPSRRAPDDNPSAYAGEEVARQQREAYPDLRPVMTPLPPEEAFARARETAEAMGWEIVAVDAAGGRIEATDRTPWFGFRDDVSIRVRPASGITRIDVRSASRVGRGDMGVNAERVRRYLAALRERVPVAEAR